MSRVTAPQTSAKHYRFFWGTGIKSESVSRGNGGIAASVLSPGGVFATGKTIIKAVDINYFHIPSPMPTRVC